MNTFPRAQEGHYRTMLKFPNRKQTFITCSGGDMQSVSYLYKVLTLPLEEEVLYILHGRFNSTVVSFTVGQLKEFYTKQRIS